MTNEKKLEMLEEMLDLDAGTLKPETMLSDLEEWDSIAVISFIALMDDEFDKLVRGKDIKEKETIGDIMDLMEA